GHWNRNFYRRVSVVGIVFSTFWVQAQNQSALATITLSEVALQAPKTQTPRTQLPFSLSVQSVDEFQKIYQQLSLQEYLVAVPGLFTQNANNYAQDLRISLRGFGARAAFGIRGIKLIVDGIPETTPDGQGQLDNLPLGLLSSVEVLRGPSASLYGNASGGVLYLNTLDQLENETIQLQSRLGAFGFQSYQLNTSLKGKKTVALLHMNRTKTDGFRQFSGFEQTLFNTKIKHSFSPKSTLQLQLNYTESPRAEDAGGIKLKDTEADWSQARQRNVEYDTYESIKQFKSGLRWQKNWGDQWNLDTYGFYIFRDFYGKLPFENGGIVDLARNYYGFGTRLNYKQDMHRWQIGIETAQQADQRDRYLNLKGAQGSLSFSQLESFDSFGFYILDEIRWEKVLLRTSLRYDDLRLGADTVSEDQTYQVLNPSVGLSYEVASQQRLFANFSSSFETPALSELSANPSGAEGLNLELEPARALNYELGWKGLWAKTRMEANVFFIESTNEILPYELEAFPGRAFYRNAGATQRWGIEVFGSYQWEKLELQASMTQAQYRFVENGTLKDTTLPGIPNSQFFLQLGYTSLENWQFQLTGEHIGSLYADTANEVQIEAFQKVRLQGGKTTALGDLELNLFAGINNLFDVRYFDNIRLNAFGGRYYEPAPGRNFFVGLSLGI
ncbi:TonB-dependent receptor, partial [Flavobacteriaceae bacterium]|nr:TonB-dependent receptor [Flavobacteriaceae bacterium]